MVTEALVQEVVKNILASTYPTGTKRRVLTRDWANEIIEQIMQEAKEKYQAKVVVGVTTKEGSPISVQSMDGAFLISFELVLKKCFTAVALQMPTHELGKLMAEGQDLEGLEQMLDNKIVGLGGGYPITIDGEIIGAVAVSGSTSTIDTALADFGKNLFERG